MKTNVILIKGMVCSRCILMLKSSLVSAGLPLANVTLGEVHLFQNVPCSIEIAIRVIKSLGFEILNSKQTRIVETVKELISDILSETEGRKKKISSILSEALNMNYDTISRAFSQVEGTTIENYIIKKKLEKVKHLLRTTNLSLTEISMDTQYSSIHHLSRQFKTVEGINPSEYRLNLVL